MPEHLGRGGPMSFANQTNTIFAEARTVGCTQVDGGQQ